MKGQNIILAVLALAGLYFGRKLFASNAITYRIIGANLKQRAIQVELINPTNTPLSVSAFVASVSIAGQNFGTIDYRTPVTIGRTDRKVLNLPIRLNPVGGFRLLSQILSGNANLKGQNINIEGTINSENLSIPVKNSIPLSV
jgi:hypothetical protein